MYQGQVHIFSCIKKHTNKNIVNAEMGYVPKPEISLTIDSKLWILYRIMKKSKFLPLPICLEKTPKLHHWWVTFSQLHITVDSGTRTSLSRKFVFFSLTKNNSSWKSSLLYVVRVKGAGYFIVWVTTFWPDWKKNKIQLRDNCRRFKLVFPYYSPWNYKGGDGFVFGKAVNIIF